ncbi:MAG: ABC transporter permease [Pseudomonadota bacterium]
MVWDWLPEYLPRLAEGVWITIQLLVISLTIGTVLSVPIGLVQVTGPRILSWMALSFCTLIRGTPLLIQLWLVYYGLGSLFPGIPGLRESFLWPYLRDAFPYAIFAFSLSVAGYQGEVMRAGFLSVSKGELEAGKAFGMGRWTLLRRIWMPRAFQNVLPTLGNEAILTLKATPLAATITVYDVFGVATIIRQETFRIYEPLLLIAGIYIVITLILTLLYRWIENRVPRPA